MISELESQLWNAVKDIYQCLADHKLEDEPMVSVKIPVRVVRKLGHLVPQKLALIDKAGLP